MSKLSIICLCISDFVILFCSLEFIDVQFNSVRICALCIQHISRPITISHPYISPLICANYTCGSNERCPKPLAHAIHILQPTPNSVYHFFFAFNDNPLYNAYTPFTPAAMLAIGGALCCDNGQRFRQRSGAACRIVVGDYFGGWLPLHLCTPAKTVRTVRACVLLISLTHCVSTFERGC